MNINNFFEKRISVRSILIMMTFFLIIAAIFLYFAFGGIKEGFQAADNIYLSMYEDNIVLTQSFNGSESDMGQKIEISMKDFPKILDGLFNLVPVNRIPANYRQSMIAKLSDKAIDKIIKELQKCE